MIKAGLSQDAYLATGAAIAFLIDVCGLSIRADLIRNRLKTWLRLKE